MKIIKRQNSIRAIEKQMAGVLYGDTVIVRLKTKDIPCVARQCIDTRCEDCVFSRVDCTRYRGMSVLGVTTGMSFIPIEGIVE